MEFKLAAAALAATLALGGAASAQTPRDTIVMAKQIDDIISLDPAESFEFSGSEVVANIYDRLIGYDLKDVTKLNGELATSWSVAPDGVTYTFKIRPGVKFHSGNAVTAEDAAYSIQRAVILNKSPGFILTQFGLNKDNVKDKVKATAPDTLVIVTDKQYAPTFFYYCLTAPVAAVVDSKLVMANAKDNDFGNAWLKQNSAGSGAYKLRVWRASDQYTLEANKNWFRGVPKNNRVVVRHIPETATQRLLLEKGDVDYARNPSKDDIAALRNNKAYTIESGNKGAILYLGLNQKNPNLAKPEVREALKWLTDYDTIERNLTAGTFKTHEAFLPIGFLGAIDDKPYKFDLAKGKALLAAAGLPNGFTVTMDVRTTSPIQDIAQAVQAQWAQAGIKLELIPGDGRQTLTKYRARNHDIYIGQWGPDYQDPHTNAETFAINLDNTDDARSKTLAWRNAWDIPGMSRTTLAAVQEQDPNKRRMTYEAVQREHQKVSPFVIMSQQIEVAISKTNVSGYIIGPSFDNNYYHEIAKK
ncbi:MAG: ABC transporter substrate-binding protein [Rhodospirillales bacterium]|nr:ABC transporter substrate-binding protein [Rhodospirillales bacterium]